MKLELKEIETYWVKIWASGLPQTIKQVCSKFCLANPVCVHVLEGNGTYIYDGGIEPSTLIEFAAFPKKPRPHNEIMEMATSLAKDILEATHQKSILVQNPEKTYWYHLT